ncbi:hypothetical protein LCGC14_0303680 [marine sediment metagenome]|uniref:Ice-binding protein C-terminal domain-containing protein n=1 Tax=marine sediment metagenome TaxID=412755 RepID=A0A0F9WVJ5_9ZZZZ
MLIRNKLFLAAMCLLAASAVAGAQTTIFSGDIYDLIVSDPVAVGAGAGGEDLVAFTVTAFNTTDYHTGGSARLSYDPVVIDSDFYGYTGITGKLHQHRASLFGIGSSVDTDVYATAIDSHWTNIESQFTPAVETYDVWPSSEPSDAEGISAIFAETSFGDHMGGVLAGYPGAGEPYSEPFPDWPLAYLVSQLDEVISFDFYVTGTKGGEHIVASYTVGQGPPGPVPEPATLALLGIGSLAMLRRKR